MDVNAILQMLVTKFPWLMVIATVLGLLVVVGQAVVAITPTTKDDEAWAKIKAMPVIGAVINALVQFAPIQKK